MLITLEDQSVQGYQGNSMGVVPPIPTLTVLTLNHLRKGFVFYHFKETTEASLLILKLCTLCTKPRLYI